MNFRRDRGTALVEYIVLCALLILTVCIAFPDLGAQMGSKFVAVYDAFMGYDCASKGTCDSYYGGGSDSPNNYFP